MSNMLCEFYELIFKKWHVIIIWSCNMSFPLMLYINIMGLNVNWWICFACTSVQWSYSCDTLVPASHCMSLVLVIVMWTVLKVCSDNIASVYKECLLSDLYHIRKTFQFVAITLILLHLWFPFVEILYNSIDGLAELIQITYHLMLQQSYWM
jgi:hypothetical protein